LSLEADVSDGVEWTGLKFSPDGRYLLISTNSSVIKMIDSQYGNLIQSFTGHENSLQLPLEASFTPDSQFVLSGSTDGSIHVWKTETGQNLCILNGDTINPVQCVAFNPKYMMIASACNALSFWLPGINSDENENPGFSAGTL